MISNIFKVRREGGREEGRDGGREGGRTNTNVQAPASTTIRVDGRKNHHVYTR